MTAAITVLAAATVAMLLLFAVWGAVSEREARTCWPGCQCRRWAATTVLDMRRAEQAELYARSDEQKARMDAARRVEASRQAVSAFFRRTGGRRG